MVTDIFSDRQSRSARFHLRIPTTAPSPREKFESANYEFTGALTHFVLLRVSGRKEGSNSCPKYLPVGDGIHALSSTDFGASFSPTSRVCDIEICARRVRSNMTPARPNLLIANLLITKRNLIIK